MRKPSLYPLPQTRAFDKGGLLDLPNAKRWMTEIERTLNRDHYGYQIPATTRSAGGNITVGNQPFVSLSSYDYLGLIGHRSIEKSVCETLKIYGTGTSGARLLTGTNYLHLQLEQAIARFIGTAAAMTVTSGYLANMTPISALFGPKDLIISDDKNHRSLHESFKLSGAEVQFFPHNDMEALEELLRQQPATRRKLIVSEGVFSMDGDRCPLPELVRLKQNYGAFLMIDEAHSLGVNGQNGRGIHEHFGLPADCVDIWTGSLSKTIPANGGYIAGSAELILYLQHAGSPFFFSSSLSPMSAAAALTAIEIIEHEPERIERLRQNTQSLITGLQALGYETGITESAVVPVIMGSNGATQQLAKELYQRGYLATAVIFPAVPMGRSRLRLCARADMDAAQIEGALAAFAEIAATQREETRIGAAFTSNGMLPTALRA